MAAHGRKPRPVKVPLRSGQSGFGMNRAPESSPANSASTQRMYRSGQVVRHGHKCDTYGTYESAARAAVLRVL